MYVAAIHRISDPDKFFAVAQEALAALPEGLKVDQMLPSVDGSNALCVWQAPSVQAVREFVDGASNGLAVNEFFEVSAEQAMAGAANPQDQYNAAFSLLRQARYEDAEQALRGFVQQHPRDSLAPAAQYWLGETFYVRKDYTNAAAAFADGYEKIGGKP